MYVPPLFDPIDRCTKFAPMLYIVGVYGGTESIPSLHWLIRVANFEKCSKGRAFRHGDIEDVLSEIAKKAGGFLGMGSKFGGLDIKRVYFGSVRHSFPSSDSLRRQRRLISRCFFLQF